MAVQCDGWLYCPAEQIYEEAAAHARVSMLSLAGAWPASPTLYRDLDTNR